MIDPEERLLEMLLAAHKKAAARDNASSAALTLAAAGSGDFCKSVTAALATLGGNHAPLEQTYDVLSGFVDVASLRIIPGWGSSFTKGPDIDPDWKDVDAHLRESFPAIYARIEMITGLLKSRGKELAPNPSCYTAATALALRMPKALCPLLFIEGRLIAWGDLFLTTVTKYYAKTLR